jgi:hypothetical protein
LRAGEVNGTARNLPFVIAGQRREAPSSRQKTRQSIELHGRAGQAHA